MFSTRVMFNELFLQSYIYLKAATEETERAKVRERFVGSAPQMLALNSQPWPRPKAGVWNSIWICQVGAGAQGLGPLSALFLDNVNRELSRKWAIEIWSNTLLWEANVTGNDLTCWAWMLSPSWVVSTCDCFSLWRKNCNSLGGLNVDTNPS